MLAAIFSAVGSPVLRYVAIGLAVFAFVAYQRSDAASDARAEATIECQAATAENTDSELQRQLAAAQRALEAEGDRAQAAETSAQEQQDRANALLEELRAQGRACPLSADELERLRGIR